MSSIVVSIKENSGGFFDGVVVAHAESNNPIEVSSKQQIAIRLTLSLGGIEFMWFSLYCSNAFRKRKGTISIEAQAPRERYCRLFGESTKKVRYVPFAAPCLGFSGVRFGAPRNALDGVSGQLQAIFLSVQPVPMRLLLLFPDI